MALSFFHHKGYCFSPPLGGAGSGLVGLKWACGPEALYSSSSHFLKYLLAGSCALAHVVGGLIATLL